MLDAGADRIWPGLRLTVENLLHTSMFIYLNAHCIGCYVWGKMQQYGSVVFSRVRISQGTEEDKVTQHR